LHRAQPAGGVRTGDDGLPLPPPSLIRMTVGGRKQALGDIDVLYRNFWRSGALGAKAIRDVLAASGFDIEQMSSILDFGCGCGRTVRHFHDLEKTEIHGTDYNPSLVGWCAENLTFGHFRPNDALPPLDFAEDQLDLVYAMSVFSHFDVQTQRLWLDELKRVVRPGGLILITLPGQRWIEVLGPEDRERFLAGEPVIVFEEQCGTNFCSALAPEPYIRDTLAEGLNLLDIVVDGAPDVRQDAVLLQKPPGS
jgi:SAM-dependent methyltransferase